MKDKKLIGEFMGLNFHGSNNNLTMIDIRGKSPHEDGSEVKNFCEVGADYLKYDSDWNWLMPVVAKIDKLPSEIVGKYMGELRWDKSKSTYHESLFFLGVEKQVNMPTDIKRVYTSTVEFIKWYNENK